MKLSKFLFFSISIACLVFLVPVKVFADKGTGKMQLLRVKNLMKAGNYDLAWKLISGFEKTDTTTAELYYLGGTCLFQLRDFENAVSQLETSIRLDPQGDIRKYFLVGRTQHFTGNPEKAIISYEKFISFNPRDKEELTEAQAYLNQSRRAIEWISKPLAITLVNMGDSINTEYPEYNPSVSTDGSTLIFTSRRPETTGQKKDPDDGSFMEDIYISHLNPQTKRWSEAKPVEGQLNTDAHDANLSISPDGNQMFVYRNMGNNGSGEIFISKKNKNGKWSAARKVEGKINSSYFESSACLSPDGNELYFVSEREKGGFGMGDIYVARKISKTEWGEPQNLGPVINDEFDQIGVFIHPDGKTIYFASDNPNGMGGYDIYKSTFENESWSKPQNLMYPINTTGDDRFFQLSADGSTAWISSNRPGGKGDIDIWQIDLSKIAGTEAKNLILPNSSDIAIVRGQITDTDKNLLEQVEIHFKDEVTGKTYKTNTDENGEYFIALSGNRNYQIKINNPGHKPITFSVYIKADNINTQTNEKNIVLE